MVRVRWLELRPNTIHNRKWHKTQNTDIFPQFTARSFRNPVLYQIWEREFWEYIPQKAPWISLGRFANFILHPSTRFRNKWQTLNLKQLYMGMRFQHHNGTFQIFYPSIPALQCQKLLFFLNILPPGTTATTTPHSSSSTPDTSPQTLCDKYVLANHFQHQPV